MTKLTKPVIFIFSFNLDPEFHQDAAPAAVPHNLDDEFNVTYAFAGEVRTEDLQDLQDDIDEPAEWYEAILDDLESDFGVHNWASGPDDRVLSLGSYNSYEVLPDRVRQLMDKWRQAFLKTAELDCSFGPVVEIPNEKSCDDWEAYQAVISQTASQQ
jgi:hypothetical protein